MDFNKSLFENKNFQDYYKWHTILLKKKEYLYWSTFNKISLIFAKDSLINLTLAFDKKFIFCEFICNFLFTYSAILKYENPITQIVKITILIPNKYNNKIK